MNVESFFSPFPNSLCVPSPSSHSLQYHRILQLSLALSLAHTAVQDLPSMTQHGSTWGFWKLQAAAHWLYTVSLEAERRAPAKLCRRQLLNESQ